MRNKRPVQAPDFCRLRSFGGYHDQKCAVADRLAVSHKSTSLLAALDQSSLKRREPARGPN
jgi:hypothetical protein